MSEVTPEEKKVIVNVPKSNLVNILICVFSFLALVGGAFGFIHSTYAKDSELKAFKAQVEKGFESQTDRIDIYILKDANQYMQQRIWTLQDRHPDPNNRPITIREEIRNLENKIDANKIEIKAKLEKAAKQ